PPGSIVRLANFEQAIVAYRTKNSLQPKVVCYKSSNGTRLKKLILRETDTPSYEIINSAIDSCTEVDLNRVWDIKIDKFSEEEIQI
ncbi:MAG: hypothetical protein OEY00_12235, partial [Gammaproteobacteria bacterium]|nr:hypothetical protein [Gammaproteobacteria bacterium]